MTKAKPPKRAGRDLAPDVAPDAAPASPAPRSRAPDGPSDETPLGYMLGVMRDDMAEAARRDAMAKTAAPYLHPKAPSPRGIEDPGKALHDLARAARETLDRKLARLAQSGPAARLSPRPRRRGGA